MDSTEEVLERYRTATSALDARGAAEKHAEDAVVISRGEVYRGVDEIEAHYEELFDWMADSDASTTIDEEIIAGDLVYVIWRMDSPDLTWEFAVDTFVIQDGEIVGHTVAVQSDGT